MDGKVPPVHGDLDGLGSGVDEAEVLRVDGLLGEEQEGLFEEESKKKEKRKKSTTRRKRNLGHRVTWYLG